jgi:diacylglycerol kinase (ATP)
VADPLNVSREYPAVIFVNAQAGGGKAQRCLREIKSLLAARDFPCEFILTGSAEEMSSRVRVAISAGSRMLLAMGGDGTLQCLVNAAGGSEVALGIVPTGGGNDFAAALGLPKNPVHAVEAMLFAQPRYVDLLRARTADRREWLYVGGGGIGLDADAARYTSSSYASLPGRIRYIASALRALKEFKPLRVHAEFPGGSVPAMDGQVLLAGVLNTPSYGAGLRLAPDARIDDGLLNVLFVKNLSATEVVAAVARLLACGDLPSSYVTRASASRVRLTADRPCLFHGDGEILGPAPVEIEVVPRAIRVVAPATHQPSLATV